MENPAIFYSRDHWLHVQSSLSVQILVGKSSLVRIGPVRKLDTTVLLQLLEPVNCVKSSCYKEQQEFSAGSQVNYI